MRPFSATELARMQATNSGAMQDICTIQSYSRTLDGYGEPVVTYTDGAAIACGVEMTMGKEARRGDMNVERIDATLRLPIATTLKAADRIKVTYRFGAALGSAFQVYEIVGEIRRGPSGLRVDVQAVTP